MEPQQRTDWLAGRLTHWLSECFVKSVREVLASLDLTGASASLKLEPGHPQDRAWDVWESPIWFALTGDMAEGASLFLGSASVTARGIASAIVPEEDQGEAAIKDAYQEFAAQIAGALSRSASQKLGRTVRFAAPVETGKPLGADMGIEFAFVLGGESHVLAVVPNDELLAVLLGSAASAAPPPTEEAARGAAEAPFVSSPAAAPTVPKNEAEIKLTQGATANLRMLLDVELDLSVSFGKTELPLEEVLKLASGAIVELNRSANDPVDVLVNNSVIARGEVVVVDGNYGIRITEVISRRARMESIF